MKRTIYLDNHKRIVPMRATGYSPVRGAQGGFQIEMSNFEQTGDGAVLTSIEDLLLWDQTFYTGKLGGPEFLKHMQETGALNNGEKLSYASGLTIGEHRGLKMVSHGGSWAGYRSDLIRFPDQKMSVVCLCNLGTANPTQLALKVAEVYLANRMKTATASPVSTESSRPSAVELPEERLKDKVGLYHRSSSGGVLRISLREGKLRLDSFDPASFELAPKTANQFIVVAQGPVNEVIFESQQSAQPAGGYRLIFKRGGLGSDVYEKVEAASPSKADLAEYTGSFYSEELDTIYSMVVEKESLSVASKNRPARELTPTFRDGFTTEAGTRFEFSRDSQGRVSGFAVQAGRIRNVRFVKQLK
jgi:hypothetical protein